MLLLILPTSINVVARTQSPANAQPTSIGGVYELAMGTTDPVSLVHYWQQFGYRIGKQGELSEDSALKLYGVRSRVRSIRMYHQAADHGLVRIMVWDQPTGEGLGMSHMKVLGNRWGAMLTANVYNIFNHAEEAALAGMPVYYVEPQRDAIYKDTVKVTPFVDTLARVREMVLIRPVTRQVLFQRFGYSLPLYGTINEISEFQSSQVTHAGMIVQGGRDLLDFYDKVLGLLRVRDAGESTYANLSSRRIFELKPDEKYITTDFDDPRSSTNPQLMRSGRLKIIRFAPETKLENKFASSRPGNLGLSLYTYRVSGIAEYHRRVNQSAARDVTAITANEFGERSFSFTAPDGYFWTLLE